MERVAQVARETGYLDGVQDFRGVETYGYLPPDKVLALCTGSQGEPRAALARIAEDEHPGSHACTRRPRDLLLPRHSRQREGGGARDQRLGDARASRSSPTATISSTSPAIRGAPNSST